MNTKVKAVIVVVSLVTAFAFGRFLTPVKVKTEIKTVEIVKIVKDTKTDVERNRHKKTTTTETVHPDGTKVITTVVTDDTETNKKTDSKETDNKDTQTDQTKEVTKTASRLNISGLGGVQIVPGGLAPVFGAAVTKDIIGPISIGAFGLTDKTFGVSLGLSF